jgi:hypothetical protein
VSCAQPHFSRDPRLEGKVLSPSLAGKSIAARFALVPNEGKARSLQ